MRLPKVDQLQLPDIASPDHRKERVARRKQTMKARCIHTVMAQSHRILQSQRAVGTQEMSPQAHTMLGPGAAREARGSLGGA
jgi:hypothetical protein